jgi:HlyD family secretion protein
MPLTPGKFRHKALQKMQSPEQLDRMLRITLPRRWIGLTGLLAVVAGVVVWSAVAAVPTTLSGQGYLLPEGGLRQVQAPVSGTVGGLRVSIGDHVVAGEPIGEILSASGKPTSILSPETGVITEADTVTHAYVSAGNRIALVQPVGWPLVVYAYVPTDVAAGLRPGVVVHVSFGAGIGARFGYATGVVQSVSQFPATPERLNFILQDPSVVSSVQKLGPSNEIVIAMDQSAHTPSGLVWGSGGGPPGALPAGLPASVQFIVGQHHPINDVI